MSGRREHRRPPVVFIAEKRLIPTLVTWPVPPLVCLVDTQETPPQGQSHTAACLKPRQCVLHVMNYTGTTEESDEWKIMFYMHGIL